MPFPPPGDLPNPGIEPAAPALAGGFFATQQPGKPICILLSQALSSDNNIYIASPGGSNGKESTCNAGDLGSIPGLGRSPEGGHGNPLQNSCLENSHEQRSLVGYSPWGLRELDTTEQLSTAQHSSYQDVDLSVYSSMLCVVGGGGVVQLDIDP